MRFSELSISKGTVAALREMGYHVLTRVQELTIPQILNGEDVIVRSQTGTGKTAAFGIGIIERIACNNSVRALVLTPTRELAHQVAHELSEIGIYHNLKVVPIYGGESIDKQLYKLKHGYDILVATPGRLLDHHNRKSIALNLFNIVVLDEADRMLDMGFIDDVDSILCAVNKNCQKLLFSATIDERILKISSMYMRSNSIIEVGPLQKVNTIKEICVNVLHKEKFSKLVELLRVNKDQKVLIFCATQKSAEYVANKLCEHSFVTQYLHGGMQQSKREHIMSGFLVGMFKILVATDVAARGLHIDDIDIVINYDEAIDSKTHLHRIGRTGRMGKHGTAITFIELDRAKRRWQKLSGLSRARDRRAFDFVSRAADKNETSKPQDDHDEFSRSRYLHNVGTTNSYGKKSVYDRNSKHRNRRHIKKDGQNQKAYDRDYRDM